MGDTKTSSKKLTAADFVHIHNHTHHSLLDGLTKIPDLVEFVKNDGMEAVAITDHGTLSGAIEMYKAAGDQGVKPLIGMEAYVAARKHTDKDPQYDKRRYHLILIAINNKGYENLMRLSTISKLDGFYYYPRIDHDLLEKYNEGLIVTSACMGSEIGQALKDQQYDKAVDLATWYKSIFGDRYYLEVQDHGHPDNPLHNNEQEDINNQIIKLGRQLDIPIVVTCDAHYLSHEDQDAHEALLCVGTGSYLSDTNRMSLKEFPLHVETSSSMIKRWGGEYPEFITNTKAIADRSELTIDLGGILIPKFDVPDGETEKSYLHKQVYQGLAWRYGGVSEHDSASLGIEQAKNKLPDDIKERAEFELDVIDNMGFNGYFLIVSDFINWGKQQGIIFGPGRGSAAGSIVSYAIRITELDPIEYDLLFERFLNPDRISMPDIDIDIQDTRRNEVIEYCARKYGLDHVANIVTFGTMAARAAVRDVARVMEVPYNEADRIAKMVPPPVQGRHIPLSKSIKENAELRQEYEGSTVAKEVIDLAIKLEGTIRSHGVHAAGVVIAPNDIVRYTPLEMAQKGVISTQYSMNPVEELGLLKMDFLGLSNLTTIKNCLRIIKKAYGTDINLDDLSLDDPETYKLLQRGDTTGVFQLESAGMKRYLRELKPTVFDDIIAMVALYRPGPMQFISDFIDRKQGRQKISYLHPGLESSLKNTYGILVYQEQFMQISKEWCGFTGGQADTLRKAVGKKKIDLMRKIKKDFVEGAIKNGGASEELAEKFWDQLEEFANYCFNKSHAACYGTISYWTAYLKTHYPDAFMAALMTGDSGDTDRLAIEINECKHMNINVLVPDINESYSEFAVVPSKNTIRFGMSAIKNVGVGAVEEIIRARDQDGPFKDVADFVTRVDTRKVNRRVWESLVKAGAFDSMGHTRADLLNSLDSILAIGSKYHKDKDSNQADLFGMLADSDSVNSVNIEVMPAKEQLKDRDMLMMERELLGLYLSSHPLESFEQYLDDNTTQISTIDQTKEGKNLTVGGVIVDSRSILTKNGCHMAFVKIEDKLGEAELIVFPSIYEKNQDLWSNDNVIIVKGKVNYKDRDGRMGQDLKIIVNDASVITESDITNLDRLDSSNITQGVKKQDKTSPKSKLKIDSPEADSMTAGSSSDSKLYLSVSQGQEESKLPVLKRLGRENPGITPIILVLIDKDQSKTALKMPFTINANEEVLEQLNQVFTPENVIIK